MELFADIRNLIVTADLFGCIAATVLAVLAVFSLLQKVYLCTAQQLQLLDTKNKGPS